MQQGKRLFDQELDFYMSVCMAAVCHIGPILAVPTSGQLLEENRMCAKFRYLKH